MASAEITRETLSFRSGSDDCAAVVVRPAGAGPFPCVVAAHGFGALKEGGPIRAVEYFAEHGYAGVAFDYRHWGESSGEPRQLLDIGRQHDDYRAAIEFARALDFVDPERIVLWGSSFSGGHVVAVAAGDSRLAAVISQAPHMDGLATMRKVKPAVALKATVNGLRDQANGLLGREPHYVQIVGEPGEEAVLSGPGATAEFGSLYDDGFEWENKIAARVGLRIGLYSPGRQAKNVSCPLLVLVCGEDLITPPEPAIRAANEAPRGELEVYAGQPHFEIYRGQPYERAMADQLAFLERSVVS